MPHCARNLSLILGTTAPRVKLPSSYVTSLGMIMGAPCRIVQVSSNAPTS
jgi:hypothetical protein